MVKPVISAGALHELIRQSAAYPASAALRVIDCSWHMPAANRSGIPGAQFFDIDAVTSKSPYPHMLPSAEQFAQHAGSALGVNNKTHVVVYDSQGIFSAPRVWMTFRTFGHENVSVLNGGLVAWKQANLPLETTKPASVTPSQFIAKLSPNLMRDFPFVDKLVRDKQVSKDNGLQIVDARSSPRFQGTVPEPRPGLAGGHMPGSRNIPFTDLLDPKTQCLLSDDELRQVFARANVDPLRPLVASCGSGVTACVIALAAFQLGNKSAAVYDGSWTEYASQPGALIECAKK